MMTRGHAEKMKDGQCTITLMLSHLVSALSASSRYGVEEKGDVVLVAIEDVEHCQWQF